MNLTRPYENLTKLVDKTREDKSLNSIHKLQNGILSGHKGRS